MAQRVYRYRLSPSRTQAGILAATCRLLASLYNAALQERREAWEKARIAVSANRQSLQLPAIRAEHPEYGAIHAQVMQDVIARLDKAFRAFFRRVKNGETPGFPRYRSAHRYRCFVFPQAGLGYGAKVVSGGGRLRIHGVGNVKIRMHREHEGKLKQIRILRDGDGHWYADFVCIDVPLRPLPRLETEVGLDLGIAAFVALSDGTVVANPGWHRNTESKIVAANRVLSRRQRGSGRRAKARAALLRLHCKTRRRRTDFHHKLAAQIVRDYGMIAIEDLNIVGLARSRVAKPVADVGWGQFVQFLRYKAESAGRELLRVEPGGTSQRCSGCGEVVKKDLSIRIHVCFGCGLTIDRDINAARNILRLGRSLREARCRDGDVASRSRPEAPMRHIEHGWDRATTERP